MFGFGVFRAGDRDQLDLGELVLTDHAPRILACSACLRAEARCPGGVAQRQHAFVEDLAGDEVGQGHLGGRDEIAAVGGAEQILFELGQLAGAKHGVLADQQRRRDLEIAKLARMEIEHKLAQRPLQPGQRPPQHDKARPGHPAGAGEIHQAEPLADRLVGQRGKIEMRLLAVMPQDPIRGLVGTVRHVLGGQVRQTLEDFIDLLP